MLNLEIAGLLIVLMFLILGSGVWIGLALLGTGWIAMELFTSRPVGPAMVTTIWGASSSWTLTALPMFIWMGEILFRTRLSQDLFRGLAPWMQRLPGRLLHTNVIGCTIFAAISGSSAATCATIGKMSIPELRQRGRVGNARPADPAVADHDRLRRADEHLDRAAFHRRRDPRPGARRHVHGLGGRLVAVQRRPHPRRGHADVLP
jgi:hypothetical protein